MMLKLLKIFSAAILFFINPIFLFAQTTAQTFAVVELFTSEGCVSCPAADKLLSEIIEDAKKNQKNIFCLEYHVDYWNSGGWKDPFSKNQFTLRQNNYSSVLKQRELYTPQMIVNGETEFTGTLKDKANTAIGNALKTPAKYELSLKIDSVAEDSVYIQYESSESNKNFSLHFAIVERGLISKISKRENSGKTLTHDNVVRIFYSIELNSKNGSVKIPLKGFRANDKCNIIAFVQHKQTMKILAAAEIKFPDF